MSREHLVRINPPTELRFKGPFTETRTAALTLTNIRDAPVCFKVKTTAPKQYCVRPNSGIVEPQSTAEVQIMLQPFDIAAAKVSKHKFMVQTMYKPDNFVDSESVWKDCNPAGVVDAKLKCSFDLEETTPALPDKEMLATSSASAEPVITTSSPVITEQPQSSSPIVSMTSPGSTFYSVEPQTVKEESVREEKEVDEGTTEPNISSAMDEVVKQRDVLQEKVSELESRTRELEDQTVRQRSLIDSHRHEEKFQPAPEVALKEGGIPIPVFVLIALIIGLIIGKILF